MESTPKILNTLSQRILQRELDAMLVQFEEIDQTCKDLANKDQKIPENQNAYIAHKKISDKLMKSILEVQSSINILGQSQ